MLTSIYHLQACLYKPQAEQLLEASGLPFVLLFSIC